MPFYIGPIVGAIHLLISKKGKVQILAGYVEGQVKEEHKLFIACERRFRWWSLAFVTKNYGIPSLLSDYSMIIILISCLLHLFGRMTKTSFTVMACG